MNNIKHIFEQNFVTLVNRVCYVKNSAPVPTFCWNNMQQVEAIKAPYIDVVKDYIADKEMEEFRKIILVTDDNNMALKTVAVMAGYGSDYYSFDEFEWGEQYPEYDEEMACCGSPVLKVDLARYGDRECKDMNLRVMLSNANMAHPHSIFFNNAAAYGDWEELISCMSICYTPCQYIQISPKQLNSPEVQRLIYELDFELLILPEFSKDYYLDEFTFLLDGTGYTLAADCNKEMLLRGLMRKRGNRFCEGDVAVFLALGIESARKDGNRRELKVEDFSKTLTLNKLSAWDRLNNMVGLSNIKSVVEESAALFTEQLNNPLLKRGKCHMVFYGNPGTGKTTTAQIMAEVFDEKGVGNGSFVVATRKDLVGKYVGHTAHQVAKCFENARGGVLFVDEAGFLLHTNSGGYVEETVKEFVRYMEEYDDVIVIFAMYPREAKEFFELDEGLRSRITRQVEFEDYSREELMEIVAKMLLDNGYTIKEGAKAVIKAYIEEAKSLEPENFGNARAMRNLTDAIISEISLRNYRGGRKDRRVLISDVKTAASKLKGISPEKKRTIGFVINKTE